MSLALLLQITLFSSHVPLNSASMSHGQGRRRPQSNTAAHEANAGVRHVIHALHCHCSILPPSAIGHRLLVLFSPVSAEETGQQEEALASDCASVFVIPL